MINFSPDVRSTYTSADKLCVCGPIVPCDPPHCQKDLVCFVFNKMCSCNLSIIVAEFSELVAWAHLPWVAKYLVKRASIELNM